MQLDIGKARSPYALQWMPYRTEDFIKKLLFVLIPILIVKVPGPGEEAEPVEKLLRTGLSDGINIEVVSGLEEEEEVLEKPTKEIK